MNTFTLKTVVGAKFIAPPGGARAGAVAAGLNLLGSGSRVWIKGVRRSGKTSTLQEISRRFVGDCPDPSLAFRVDLADEGRANPDVAGLVAESLRAEILTSEAEGLEPLRAAVDQLRQQSLKALGEVARSWCAREGRLLLVAFDEVAGIAGNPLATEQANAVVDVLTDSGAAFMVGGPPRFDHLAPDSPLRRLFDPAYAVDLRPFGDDEIRAFEISYGVPDASQAELRRLAGGHPYLMQLACTQLHEGSMDAIGHKIAAGANYRNMCIQDAWYESLQVQAQLIGVATGSTQAASERLRRLASDGWLVREDSGQLAPPASALMSGWLAQLTPRALSL